jgi:hypothetical protein
MLHGKSENSEHVPNKPYPFQVLFGTGDNKGKVCVRGGTIDYHSSTGTLTRIKLATSGLPEDKTAFFTSDTFIRLDLDMTDSPWELTVEASSDEYTTESGHINFVLAKDMSSTPGTDTAILMPIWMGGNILLRDSEAAIKWNEIDDADDAVEMLPDTDGGVSGGSPLGYALSIGKDTMVWQSVYIIGHNDVIIKEEDSGGYIKIDNDSGDSCIELMGNASKGVNIAGGPSFYVDTSMNVGPSNICMYNLPTTDPSVVGALWVDTASGNVIKMSTAG